MSQLFETLAYVLMIGVVIYAVASLFWQNRNM
jgi:hypothetical protein